MGRAGVTLPELVLVAWLFVLVLLAVARFAGAQSRLVATTHYRVRQEELLRVATVVLDRELRTLTPHDFGPVIGDSIRLRAVRGSGPLCGPGSGKEVVIQYRGTRRPDPEKDSLLLVSQGGTSGSAYAVRGAARDDACAAALRVTLDPAPPPTAGFALVYETGVYSISSGALRYRRGAGGRQPLTEAVLAGGHIRPRGPTLALAFELDPDSLPVGVTSKDLSVYLVNGADP